MLNCLSWKEISKELITLVVICFTPGEDVLHFNERYESEEFNIMFGKLNFEILMSEISNAIKQLKGNRAVGPEYVLNYIFN